MWHDTFCYTTPRSQFAAACSTHASSPPESASDLRQTTPRADGVPNGAPFREEKHRGLWVAVVPLPTYLLVLACCARVSPESSCQTHRPLLAASVFIRTADSVWSKHRVMSCSPAGSEGVLPSRRLWGPPDATARLAGYYNLMHCDTHQIS